MEVGFSHLGQNLSSEAWINVEDWRRMGMVLRHGMKSFMRAHNTSMPEVENHANPVSLLGQLQRGRGNGFLRVLSAPRSEAQKLLEDCICNDPRLDSQVESRSEYYGSMAVEIGLTLTPLAAYLREYDGVSQSSWNSSLCVETLGEMAKRDYANAFDILCDYIGWGQWWDLPLEDLLAGAHEDRFTKVVSAVERRFPSDDELAKALAWFASDYEPWATLSQRSERIRDNLPTTTKKEASRLPSSTELDAMNTKQILELVDEKNWHKLNKVIGHVVRSSDLEFLKENASLKRPFVADVALAGLVKLASDDMLDWVRDYWRLNPKMRGFHRRQAIKIIMSVSPKLTLPLARERLFADEWHERYLAEEIFESYATVEDVPMLRDAIRQAMQDDEANCYRLCNLVDAFAHLPAVGSVPELKDVYVGFRYSYGRGRAATAINITNPSLFRDEFAFECLWDCENKTRTLGAKVSSREDAAANRRLRQLASDCWEDKTVIEESENRLKSDPAR